VQVGYKLLKQIKQAQQQGNLFLVACINATKMSTSTLEWDDDT